MPNRVYIVEDHADMLHTYEFFIARLDDLAVHGTALSAEAAIEEEEEVGEADVALIDVSLPGMSGIELVGRLRERYPSLPCLVVSGHSENVYAASAYRAGAKGYVMKGNPPAILNALQEVLDGKLCFSENVRRRLAL